MDQNSFNNQFNTPPYYAPPGKTPGYNYGAASLICGIVGFLSCACLGIPAIILGIIAIVFFNKSKKLDFGNASGIATSGLVCGIISIIFGLVSIIYWILVVCFTVWQSPFYYL